MENWRRAIQRQALGGLGLACLLLSLLSTPACADGSAEVGGFPITGAYRAIHREDRGGVAIIEFVGDYNRYLSSGESNIEARAVVAQEFLRTHPDQYDFLVIFSTFTFDAAEATALHWGVQNTVQGIGIAPYNVAQLFGSAGRLLGYIDMTALSRHVLDPLQPRFEDTLATLGHEVLHQWSGRARFVDAQGQVSSALLGRNSSHWSDLLHTNASVLYGHKWRDNQDGTFTSEAIRQFMSPLDLYLAGFYRQDEVPPFLLIDNPGHDPAALPQPDITLPGTARMITVDDVIAAEGPRLPSADQAQKIFRFAWIVLASTEAVVDQAQISAVAQVRRTFAERFAVWTGGRALAVSDQVELLTLHPGTPEPLGGGTLRITPAALETALQDGLQWLRSQQRSDGSWQDKAATHLRDTTVVLEALSHLDPTFTGQAMALNWLTTQRPESTDYRARQVQMLAASGADVAALGNDFLALASAQGGWGAGPGYAPEALDTALVITALAQQPDVVLGGLEAALHFLVSSQNPDGGWGTLAGGPSRIGVTTLVLRALQICHRQQTVAEAALVWLASQQQPDGGFGEGLSTVHETAQALQTSIALGMIEHIRAGDAAAYLLARQQTDGSWTGSTYATALAVGALKRLHFPNWHVESELTASLAQPVDGERVLLRLTVRNDGQSPAPIGRVRLYDGDPGSGGHAVGQDGLIPALAPGASVTVSLPWDTSGATGQHTLVALIDPDQGQAEVSEQDNRVIHSITVQSAPPGIDLTAEALTVTPAYPDALPTTLGISAIIRNLGMTPAAQVRVQLRDVAHHRLVAERTYNVPGRGSVLVTLTDVLTVPGSTTFRLIVDPDNLVPESSKSNNTAETTLETIPSVDVQLSASDVTLTPQVILRGMDVVFTVTLHNTGTSLSPPTLVHYVVTDGQSTEELGDHTVQIDAGSAVQRSLLWRATHTGQFTFTVQLDPAHRLPETHTQNNQASVQFSVGEAQGPNLVVSFHDLTLTPEPGLAGKPLTMTALVRNTGTEAAHDIPVAFYDADPGQGGRELARHTIPLLAADAAATVTAVWPRVPSTTSVLVFVRVDPEHSIAEFSATDNTAFRVLEVHSLPDLAITPADIRLTPGFPGRGQTVLVEARLTNLGQQPASDVLVRAFEGISGGSHIGPDQRVSVPGESTGIVQWVWTPLGTDDITGIVVAIDPENTLDEQARHNNTAQKRLAVQASDMFVSQRYISPDGNGVKDSTTLFFRVPGPEPVEVVGLDQDGTLVRQLRQFSQENEDSVEWDGLDDQGRVVRDGIYRLQVRNSAAASLGEAQVVVDTNRTSLLEAIGTPFGVFTNLTCALGEVRALAITDDEATIVLAATDSSALPPGIYRMGSNGTGLTPLVPLQVDDVITSMHMAPNGAVVAYIQGLRTAFNQEKLFVVQGDGSNARELPLAQRPQEIVGVLTATSEVLLLVEERSGAFRQQLVAVSLFGGSPRLLYSTASRFETLVVHGLSPRRDHLVIQVHTFTEQTYHVVQVLSGARQQIATYDPSALPDVIQWSPDSTQLALKHLEQRADGTQSYSLILRDTQGNLRRRIDLPLSGDENRCIFLASDNLVWAPDGTALAFDLVHEGLPECRTGDVFAGGLYIAETRTGTLQQVLAFDDSSRGYYENTRRDRLAWFQNDRALLYASVNNDISAIFLDENTRQVKLLDGGTNPVATLDVLQLSPSNRQVFYRDDRDASNPQSACYQQGGTDYWSYRSLLNLTADLQATRTPQGGALLLHGTVSDRYLEAYALEYASSTPPYVWQPLQPAASQMVVNDVLATWVPPAPGAYLLRLTATDLAGNQRQQLVRVVWAENSSITDLYRTSALFSPNGDHTLEHIGIHYRVLQPVHLTFDFLNDAGERVRTIPRDHATVGIEDTLVWDGRDDHGLLLPDGLYRLQVGKVSLPITIDSTPPAVTLRLNEPYQAITLPQIGPVVQVAPSLVWSIHESHYQRAIIETASTEQPEVWQLWRDLGPPYTGDGAFSEQPLSLAGLDKALFRLSADDTAGNRTVVQVGPVAPQLIIEAFGDHRLNARAQECSLRLHSGEDFAACVREAGGYYQPLTAVPYAPLGAPDVPQNATHSVFAVTAPTVRFALAESIAQPLTQLVVQYRPVAEAQWQEMALEQFMDQALPPHLAAQPLPLRMDALWDVPALSAHVLYVVRLKAIDAAQQEHVSNPLLLQIEHAVLLHGLLLEATREERRLYDLPLLVEAGKTGVWGLNVSREALHEVRLVVQSHDDPRYRVAQEVASIELPEQVMIFAAALAACKSYEAYVLGTTVSGAPVRSLPHSLQVPCLNLVVQVEPASSMTCEEVPTVPRLHIRFAPSSRNGDTLKLLTLARLDATGQEDVLFNVNRPDSVSLPHIKASPPSVFVYDPVALNVAFPGLLTYPYVYTYDTSALPEGRVELLARLVDINDESIALPIDVLVDHTPPTLTWTFPPEGGRVCGVPLPGQDGRLRNVVTLEGSVADAHGVHYVVRLGHDIVHDSRQFDSFAAALGQPAQVLPPFAPFHLPRRDGPLARLVDQQGAVTVQFEVFDWGGFQQCTSRTFFVDGQVEVEPPVLSRRLFSPTGDSMANDVTLSYQAREPSRLDLAVYTATPDTRGRLQVAGAVLRHIETSKMLPGGSATSTWDGRDTQGQVVPDGWYGLVFVFTDTCGNQQRYEEFVEVDATPPHIVVEAPQAQTPLTLLVAVQGSITDQHLSTYRVQVGGGTAPQTWAVLNTGTGNMVQAVLAQWNTFGLNGPFVLRLIAQDQVGNTSTADVPLTLTTRTNLLSSLTATPSLFSPNGDGRRDHTSVNLGIEEDVLLTVTVHDANGLLIRTLAANQAVARGTLLLPWDGTNQASALAPDGVYTALVTATLARSLVVTQQERLLVTVDSTPPRVTLLRPAEGFIVAAGQVQGSITDPHLSAYSVTLTETPAGPHNLLLSSGSSSVVQAPLGSVHGLQEGAYALTIEAQDAADNAVRQRVAFTVDNTPPVLELTAPGAGSVVGQGQNPILLRGSITEEHFARYQLKTGAGADPAVWMELVHSTSRPSTDVLGSWDITTLPDGLYTLQVLADDQAGQRTEKRLALTVDHTPPTVALTAPSAGAYVTAAQPITGTATDTNLALYRLEIAPDTAPENWSLLGSGTTVVENQVLQQWRDLPPDGKYIIRLTAVDKAGHSTATTQHVSVDTTPPGRLTGVTATLGQQQVRLLWPASTAADLAGYTVYRDTQRLTQALVSTPEYADTTVAEGRYTYTVTASDRAGLESLPSVPVTVSVDSTPPQVRISVPASGATVSGVLDITGTAYSQSDFKTYRVLTGAGIVPAVWQLLRQSPVPVQADVLSQWNTLGLSEGAQYSIKLEGEDLAGNIASEQIVVRIDNQAPAAPTGLLATASGARVQLSWVANSDTDLLGYLVYRNARLVQANTQVVGDLRVLAVRTPAYTEQTVVDGPHTYTIVAIDQAGNSSAPSAPAMVQVNTQAPHADLVQPRDGTVFDGALELLASVADNDIAQVQFYYRAAAAPIWVLLGTDATAPYEATFAPAALGLAFGTYQLRAVATDTSQQLDPAPGVVTVTYADRTRPGRVQGLAAQVDGDTVHLQWSASGDTDLAGYHVERQQDTAAPLRLTTGPLSNTSYVDNGLAEASYRYTVVAVDTHNNTGDPTSPVSAVVYTPLVQVPHTPTTASLVTLVGHGTPLAAVYGQVATAGGSISLAPGAADAAGNFTLSDVVLAPDENRFTLQLIDHAGNRSKPATLTVVSAQPPSPPTGLMATAAGATAYLTWNPNPEADVVGYRLWRNGLSVLADLPITDGSMSAGDRLLAWPVPRQITQLQIQWASAAQRASAFTVEAWSGQHWVPLVHVHGNQQIQNVITLAPAYRTTQLRVVVLTPAGTLAPSIAALRGTYTPLITSTGYDENMADGHYTYTLTAANVHGLESSPSAPASVAVGDVLAPAPVALTATVLGSAVQLNWTASSSSDAQRYNLIRNGLLLTQVSSAAPLQYVDAHLINGTYTYAVTVSDAVGNTSAVSNQVAVHVALPPPDAPQHLRVTPLDTGGALELQWSPGGGGQAGFRVWRALHPGGPYIAVSDSTATTLTDSGLVNETTYYYVIVALDTIGNASAFSPEASGTARDRLAPAPPRLYFPTVAGRVFSTDRPQSRLIGTAEPGAQVQLFANGQRVASTTAQPTETALEIALPVGARPVLSPDGRYVAFLEPSQAGSVAGGEGAESTGVLEGQLRLYDSLTGSIDEVARVRGTTFLRWAPDSTALLLNEQDAQYHTSFISAYTLAEEHLSRLTDPAQTDIHAAVLSPDGARLVVYGAVLGKYGLWLQDSGNSTYIPLVSVASATAIEGASVQWSPDGASLAYRKEGAYEIVQVATGQSQRVDAPASAYAAQWAPDGQSLLYAVLVPDEQIRLYDLRTGTAQAVINGLAPQWSADGQSLLYITPAADALIRRESATGIETTLLQETVLVPGSLQVVPTGFVGVLRADTAAQQLYERVDLAGRFTSAHVTLSAGDNIFVARAVDMSGNISTSSEALMLTYRRGPQADLTLSPEAVAVFPTVPIAGELTRVSITVSNGGTLASAPSALSLIAIDPAGHGTVLLDYVPVDVLQEGESVTLDAIWTLAGGAGRYTLAAVVDPDNTVLEHSEANNVVLKDVVVAEQAIPTVTVSTDALLYNGIQPVHISGQVSNAGASWTGRVVLSVTDPEAFVVHTLYDMPVAALAYGDSLPLTATWHSGTTLAGAYLVLVRLLDQQGNVIASATAPFHLAEASALEVTVSSDRSTYTAHTDVRLTGTLTYTAGNHLLSAVAVQWRIVDPEAHLVASHIMHLGDLLPGAIVGLPLDWNTGHMAPGLYQATVEVTQAGQALAQAQTQLTIAPSGLRLTGQLSLTEPAPEPGRPQKATATLRNQGNSPALHLPVIFSLLDPVTGIRLDEQRLMTNLAVTGQTTHQVTFATATLALQSYTVLLQVSLDDGEGGEARQTLATQTFVVTDRSGPRITVATPTAGGFLRADGTVSVIVQDDLSQVAQAEWRLDGGAWQPVGVLNATTKRYDTSLSQVMEGSHSIEVRAADIFGNVTMSPAVVFAVDATPPQIVVSGVVEGMAYAGAVTPVIVMTEDHPAETRITLNGQPFASGTTITAEDTYQLAIVASDQAGNQTASIINFFIDTTPPLIALHGVQDNTVYQGTPYLYQLEATDPDGDALRYMLPVAPPDMRIDAQGRLTWWPQQPGEYDITVHVEDLHGGLDTQSYTLTVTVANMAPVILSAAPDQGVVQQPYVYVVEAVDPNGDPLTYSLDTAPVDMQIDTVTGLLSWTPSLAGDVTVGIRVQDRYGAAATQRYTLHVGNVP